MKPYNISIKILVLLVFSTLILNSCGIFVKKEYDQSKIYEAIEYNDALIDEETKVIEKINNLDDAVNDFDYSKIKTELTSAKNQVDASIKTVKRIKAFYGDSSFKNETLSFLNLFSDLLDNEYTEILKINEKCGRTIFG